MSRTTPIASSIRTALMLGLGASFLAIPGAALAQQNQDQDEEQAQERDRPERIQVVGSRIRTDGLDSNTPIEIISADLANEQGLSTLGELLRTSTVASGSDQLLAAYSVGFVTAGGSGAESISMRGLGANRTLVLLNGRRAGPAGTRGQVSAFDMNALPVSAIERVEILKDGASSLYGSDAVAGVINIITKRGDDAQFNVSGSMPTDSGGETYRINGTFGESYSRGSWRVVADYNVNTGLKRGDRDYFDCSERYLTDQLGFRADPIDPRTGEFHCSESGPGIFHGSAPGGRFQYDYGNNGFAPVTETNPNVTAQPDGFYWAGYDKETDGLLDGGSHPFRRTQTMIPETEVVSVYLQADYDLTNNISMYGELLHSSRETESRNTRQFWTAQLGYRQMNDYAPGWEGEGLVMPVSLTDWFGNETTVDYTRGVLGLEGSLGYWNWDVSWQRTLNDGEYKNQIIFFDSMLMAQETLLGLRDCGPDEVTQYSQKECVVVPFFDPQLMVGNPSDEVRDFLFGSETGRTIYKQDSIDAYITGDLYELPAGPIGSAFGVYYQYDEIQDTPGFHTLNGNSWGLTGSGITAGSSDTFAAYAEIQIPVVRDLPFVESFDITASGRFTDVSTYGSGETYKLSAVWDIANGFRVRASQGTSFRAPALFELFLDDQTGFLGQVQDPCVNWVESANPLIRENCAAAGIPDTYIAGVGSSMTAVTSGGQGLLEAETSVSKGIGLVYTSPENRIAASIDYYDVTISDQVTNVGGAAVLNQCYTSENFATDPFCNQITRRDGTNGDWGVEEVRGGYLNTSEQKVRGVDIVVTYRESFDFGDLRIRWDHTNQIERSFLQFADSDRLYYIGRVGNPKHVGTINSTFSRNDWSFNWNIQYYDKTNNYWLYANENRTTYRGRTVTAIAETPTYILHSFSATKNMFNDSLDLTVGIANAFDKKPPTVTPSFLNTAGNTPLFASQYDYLGQRVFFNAQYRF
ncbi:MAG: TonB-dependent receptor [Idiomarina sp.]|nr:TonB-dependent receptor [Idiomarina sp.]